MLPYLPSPTPQRDEFFLSAPNIGLPKAAKLRFQPVGLLADAWHCDKVQVQSSANGQLVTFPVKAWFNKQATEAMVYPEAGADGAPGGAAAAGLLDYDVIVYTSDVANAGTDANVTVELRGSKGALGATRLVAKGFNAFERGGRNAFKVPGSDVGDLRSVVVAHDGASAGADWHLAKVLGDLDEKPFIRQRTCFLRLFERSLINNAGGCSSSLVSW